MYGGFYLLDSSNLKRWRLTSISWSCINVIMCDVTFFRSHRRLKSWWWLFRRVIYFHVHTDCCAYLPIPLCYDVDQEIAEFIAKRDGHPARADRIYLTNGASEGEHGLKVSFTLSLLLTHFGCVSWPKSCPLRRATSFSDCMGWPPNELYF